jgi:hypothetical protein
MRSGGRFGCFLYSRKNVESLSLSLVARNNLAPVCIARATATINFSLLFKPSDWVGAVLVEDHIFVSSSCYRSLFALSVPTRRHPDNKNTPPIGRHN